MEHSILDEVVKLLCDGGVPAAPAQPEKDMLVIHTPVAAVSIEKVDRANGTAAVLVEVVAPSKNGARRCQMRALDVCEILTRAGAQCVQGNCIFVSKAALFRVQVTALFYGTARSGSWTARPACSVTLAGVPLAYVRSFSAQQKVDETHPALADSVWEFALEEFFPAGAEEPEDAQEPFTLEFSVAAAAETFTGCTMTQRERSRTSEGIHQIRKGKATGRTVE